YRSVERTSTDGIDDEEPRCNRSRSDETGDHAFTQKIMRPFSHRCPLLQWGAVVVRRKYANAGYIPSEQHALVATVRASESGTVLAKRWSFGPLLRNRFFKRSTAQDVLSQNSNRDPGSAPRLRRRSHHSRIA